MRVRPVQQKSDATIGLLIFAGTALGISIPASAQSTKPTVEQLQKEIKQRDALIRSLVQRVEKLEQQVGTSVPVA